jgi:hypothetical protein
MFMDYRKRLEIINDLATRIETALGSDFLSCPNPGFPIDDIDVDIVVDYKRSVMIAIGVYINEDCCEKESFLLKALKRTHIPVGFLFDENLNIHIFLNKKGCLNKTNIGANLDNLISLIREQCATITVNPNKQEVEQKLMHVFDSIPDFDTKNACKNLLKSCCDNLKYSLGQIFLSEKDENQFMLTLLGKVDCDFFWRYTSFSSLFETLKEQKQILRCPISMNDASEGTYADSKMPWFDSYIKNDTYYSRKNDVFILSCCECGKEDDLVMWRLYGDDSKGVCIKYSVDSDKIDKDHVFLARVNYANKNDNTHPELDFLACLQNTIIAKNWYFILRKWHIWRYFFKSSDYDEENEIRLVFNSYQCEEKAYRPEIEWFLDRSSHIPNKMAKFSVENFPLRIEEIVLGPNMPNAETNIEQIEYMALNELDNITKPSLFVRKSKIKNYRR